MTMTWKLLFFVLNISYLVTKLFLALYLVSIYVEYMYMGVHMCIINLHVIICEYVFSCFPCYFEIDNYYVIVFISHTKV